MILFLQHRIKKKVNQVFCPDQISDIPASHKGVGTNVFRVSFGRT